MRTEQHPPGVYCRKFDAGRNISASERGEYTAVQGGEAPARPQSAMIECVKSLRLNLHCRAAKPVRRWLVSIGVIGSLTAGCNSSSGALSPTGSAVSSTSTETASDGATSTSSGAAITPPEVVSDNPFRVGHTLVIPHAGGDGLFPENTLYAYEQSMAMGGEVIDLDVYLTADNTLIAFHDSTLDRTTNGTGKVSGSTYADIAKLDAGSDFSKDGEFPFRGKGLTVPTIESVLQAFPSTLATLDLKDQRVAVVEPLCALLRELGRTEDVYVGIDVEPQVLAFREQCPEVRTSGTDAERQASRAAREAGDTTFVSRQLVGQPGYLNDDGTWRITDETLAWAQSHDTAILTWTVDDPDDMERLVRMGIDGLYTRFPDRLVAVIAKVEATR
jgi:glycerophosphoryl diester phosphodiesterase